MREASPRRDAAQHSALLRVGVPPEREEVGQPVDQCGDRVWGGAGLWPMVEGAPLSPQRAMATQPTGGKKVMGG